MFILSEEHSTVELLSSSSLLEVSWCLSAIYFTTIVIAFVAAPSILCLNCFVSAGLLLLFPCITCQINSHKLIQASDFVVGDAIPCPSLWWLTTQQMGLVPFHCNGWFLALYLVLPDCLCFFVDWEQHLTGHKSPQWILACDSLVGSAHWYIWHSQLLWCLFCWIGCWKVEFSYLVGPWLTLVDFWFGLVVSFYVICLDSLYIILFLWFWVQASHSFDPFTDPFCWRTCWHCL